MKRVILIVLDSAGIGESPDSADYGDSGCNTLIHIKERVPGMELKNLNELGLSSIDGAAQLKSEPSGPVKGSFGKFAEESKGKDTTVGHWELAGILVEKPMPTYPDGFPDELIARFERAIGRKTLGNCTASGLEIIDRFGGEHVSTGRPIVYTSADSVFQIAMHEGIIPVEEQYRISQAARELLVGEHAVSRVITRPFTGTPGSFSRTANRRDFSLDPIKKTMLDYIKEAGLEVAAVGKIEDIFAGRGITESVHTKNNMDGVDKTLELMGRVKNGLIFVNLVDFDMLFGHRNDAEGYAEALVMFDRRLPEITARLRPDDILMITADHGCDPTMPGTDHSREYIPLLVYGERVKPGINLHTGTTYSDIGSTILDYLGVEGTLHGTSFLQLVLRL